MSTHYQFMVDFDLPPEITQDFIDLLPQQRAIADQYLMEGKLLNYSFSVERAKIWAVFAANSEFEVREMLFDFPLTPYMEMNVSLLSFHDAVKRELPEFSEN